MSQKEFFEYLEQTIGFASKEIAEAFREIDRADFVLPEYQEQAYFDYSLPIGFGATISQPFTVAFMINKLDLKPGQKILDIGSGSGWTTALLAHIVGKRGKVIGTEIVPELVKFGNKNLAKYDFSWAKIFLAGKELGLAKAAPFDRILVSAAASEFPKELLDQLKVGGKIVIPIQSSIWQIDKVSDSEIKSKEFEGFAFVPLR